MKICFTGHRPDKLGGYNWNSPKNQKIIKKLTDIIENEIVTNSANSFIFGGALGIDQMSFDIVQKLSLTYKDLLTIIAVPFKQQASRWNVEDRERYASQLYLATEVVFVDEVSGYQFSYVDVGKYHPVKMQFRNQWMVDNADKVIAVWNEKESSGTYKCVKYAQKIGKEILVLNPEKI